MILRSILLWLLGASISFAVTPASPAKLAEWMRAVELGHKDALKCSPEVLLTLTKSKADLKSLRDRADLPFEDKKCLDHEVGFRKAVDLGLRRLELSGRLAETQVIDEIFFGRAGRIRAIEPVVNAARRLALNRSKESLLRLCETVLLTPWMDRHATADPGPEAANTYRLFVRERLILFDLMNEHKVLPDFIIRARAQIQNSPNDFKSVQALIYAGLLQKNLPDDVWELYATRAPGHAGWKVEPLLEMAYYCLDRQLPAPTLYQELPGYLTDAREASRHRATSFVQLHLLQAAHAVLLSELDEARDFHLKALEEFDKLRESSKLHFLESDWRLVVASFEEPFVAPLFQEWIDRLETRNETLKRLSPVVFDLREFTSNGSIDPRLAKPCRELAHKYVTALLKSEDPNHLSLLQSVCQRHLTVLLREGRINEAEEFYTALRQRAGGNKNFERDFGKGAAWIEAAKTPGRILLIPDALKKHRILSRWFVPKVGLSQRGLSAAFFPVADIKHPFLRFFDGQNLKPLEQKAPISWQDGFGRVVIPPEVSAPWIGASLGDEKSPLALVVSIERNLLSGLWETGKDGLPGLIDWQIKEEKNGVVLRPSLSKTVELSVDLISEIIPLEEGYNYVFSGSVKSNGKHANTKVMLKFFDEERNVIDDCLVAFQQGSPSHLESYFQILVNQDRSPGPSIQITPKHKYVRVILQTSESTHTRWSNLGFGKYCLSNPEEIIRPKTYLDAKSKPFLEFNHPVDAMATNDKHSGLAVAIGTSGKLYLYPGGSTDPEATRNFPKNTEVSWLSFAENETVGLISKRKAAAKGVFYLFRKDGSEVIIPIKGRLLTQTLDRMGRWITWIEERDEIRQLCYHDLRNGSAKTIRSPLDLKKEEGVIVISSIWTNDGVALLGRSWRRDYSFPGMNLKRTLADEETLDGPESPGLSRVQSNNFLMSACRSRPLPTLISQPTRSDPIWIPKNERAKMIRLKRNGSRPKTKTFEFRSELGWILPVHLRRKGSLERDLLFTLKKESNLIRRIEHRDLLKVGLSL